MSRSERIGVSWWCTHTEDERLQRYLALLDENERLTRLNEALTNEEGRHKKRAIEAEKNADAALKEFGRLERENKLLKHDNVKAREYFGPEIEQQAAVVEAARAMVILNEDGYQTAEEWQAAIDNLREALTKLDGAKDA